MNESKRKHYSKFNILIWVYCDIQIHGERERERSQSFIILDDTIILSHHKKGNS